VKLDLTFHRVWEDIGVGRSWETQQYITVRLTLKNATTSIPSSGFPGHTDGQQHDLYAVAVKEVDDVRHLSADLDGSFLHDFND